MKNSINKFALSLYKLCVVATLAFGLGITIPVKVEAVPQCCDDMCRWDIACTTSCWNCEDDLPSMCGNTGVCDWPPPPPACSSKWVEGSATWTGGGPLDKCPLTGRAAAWSKAKSDWETRGGNYDNACDAYSYPSICKCTKYDNTTGHSTWSCFVRARPDCPWGGGGCDP